MGNKTPLVFYHCFADLNRAVFFKKSELDHIIFMTSITYATSGFTINGVRKFCRRPMGQKSAQIPTITETPYARKASKYIEILNELRRIGAHSTVNLPTIVFCGNQSAGKSSLLEAISGVRLPRSDGTCTRCVMELRLIESNEPWQCQIFLRYEYDNDEKRLSPNETKFGNKIVDPLDVEIMARRAQKALLNPSNNSDEYFNWDFNGISYEEDANLNSLKFTKNVVCLEIKGSNVPNLSLIDLPGIIHHTERIEDRKFVEIIRDLVKNYIRKEESIIVATISCKDEIDNQEIVSLAREADPSGKRTLGVLTKPDTVEIGTHEAWLKIMRGESHKLSLGYYIVKNPNKQQLMENITFEEAREEEIDFFEKSEPWRDNQYLSERIGVKKLQLKLSDLLIKAIMHSLPIINGEVREKLKQTRDELEKIPEPLCGNLKAELYFMAKKCATAIEKEMDCSSDSVGTWSSIVKEFKQFKKDLYFSRPIFTVGSGTKEFDTLEEFARDIKKEELDPTVESQKIPEADIINYINDTRGKLLPGFVPYSLVKKLIRDSQNKWEEPSHECLTRVYEIMSGFVKKVVEETFSRFPALHIQMEICANKWLNDCKEETINHIRFVYELERDNDPLTLDESLMISKKVEYLCKLNGTMKIEGRDPSEALEVIASVMAYLNLSFRRYVEFVSMTIINTFVGKFTKQIERNLIEVCMSDYCDPEELIREDHSIVNRREELHKKEKHMKEVLDSLIKFGVK